MTMSRTVALLCSLTCLLVVACDDASEPRPSQDAGGPDVARDTTPAPPLDAARTGACPCSGSPNQRLNFPLECACGADPIANARTSTALNACGLTREMYGAQACGDGGHAVLQMTGCGKVALAAGGGFVSSIATYDMNTQRLVGFVETSDVGFGECRASQYRFGETLTPNSAGASGNCSQVQMCLVCGDRRLFHMIGFALPAELSACPAS
jgi:hypothetical protein